MVGRGEADWEHAGLEDTTTRHGVEVWENPRETDGAHVNKKAHEEKKNRTRVRV